MAPPGAAVARAAQDGADRSRAWFRYVGATGATVTGAATGTVYRFGQPGALISVDARDRRSLAAVPVLRQEVGPGG